MDRVLIHSRYVSHFPFVFILVQLHSTRRRAVSSRYYTRIYFTICS